MLTRRDILCQCVGGAGAVVRCAGMIVSLAAGLAGTAGSTLIQRSGMAGMGSMVAPAQGQAGVPAPKHFKHDARRSTWTSTLRHDPAIDDRAGLRQERAPGTTVVEFVF